MNKPKKSNLFIIDNGGSTCKYSENRTGD